MAKPLNLFYFFLVKPLFFKQNLFLFFVKLLCLGKIFFSSWFNLFLLTKPHFFLAKPLLLDKTFFLSWLNLYLLEKHFHLLGEIVTSWQNLFHFLVKTFYFLTKLLHLYG